MLLLCDYILHHRQDFLLSDKLLQFEYNLEVLGRRLIFVLTNFFLLSRASLNATFESNFDVILDLIDFFRTFQLKVTCQSSPVFFELCSKLGDAVVFRTKFTFELSPDLFTQKSLH